MVITLAVGQHVTFAYHDPIKLLKKVKVVIMSSMDSVLCFYLVSFSEDGHLGLYGNQF